MAGGIATPNRAAPIWHCSRNPFGRNVGGARRAVSMKPLELMPEARLDLLESIEWYERVQKGLGRAVRIEHKATLNRVRDNPCLFAAEEATNVRIAPLRRFPLGVAYVVEPARIWVIAVEDIRRGRRRYFPPAWTTLGRRRRRSHLPPFRTRNSRPSGKRPCEVARAFCFSENTSAVTSARRGAWPFPSWRSLRQPKVRPSSRGRSTLWSLRSCSGRSCCRQPHPSG